MKFRIIVEPDGDGFHAKVPVLPGCGSWGKTREEALANIKEAIEMYLENDEPVETSEELSVVELELP
jgi:predicted RNase H-like HicB family nuclease